MMNFAEYIWVDGTEPTRQLRSKTRTLQLDGRPNPSDFPEWSFDGSSTGQASDDDSDCTLMPVAVATDPFRGEGCYLVLCEVFLPDGRPHPSNTRYDLRTLLAYGGAAHRPWVGFEQEYTLFKDGAPLGFSDAGEPEHDGNFYCGVGADRTFGRDIAEEHAQLCVDAGLMYYGLNAEVMPGQWEFQVGYRGVDGEDAGLLRISDDLWLARWILERVAEQKGVSVSFRNKPMKGDWKGAGMHTNFSTNETRDPAKGMIAIDRAIKNLSSRHYDHIAVYGYGLEERLTGHNETSAYGEFRAATADRNASIRIPQSVQQRGYGYFEDRRPGANADPYEVSAQLTSTVLEIDMPVHPSRSSYLRRLMHNLTTVAA